jgi:hypothetical protein
MAVRVDGENGVVVRQFVVAILVTDDRSRGVRPSEATVTACFRRRRQQMEGAYGDLMCLVILNVLLLQELFFSPLLQVLLLPFFCRAHAFVITSTQRWKTQKRRCAGMCGRKRG